MSIQTDYTTLTAALGRRAHSHHVALSFAAFLAEKVWRIPSLNAEKNRDDSLDCGMETTTLHATVEGIIMVLLR